MWTGLPGQPRLDCRPAVFVGPNEGFSKMDFWNGLVPLNCTRRSVMVSALQHARAGELRDVEEAGCVLIRAMASGRYPQVTAWSVEGFADFLRGFYGNVFGDAFIQELVAKVMVSGALQADDPVLALAPVRRLMEILTARDETPGLSGDATGGVPWEHVRRLFPPVLVLPAVLWRCRGKLMFYRDHGVEMVRANHGHRFCVDYDGFLEPFPPGPKVLYHGTWEDRTGGIDALGLGRMTCSGVYFSEWPPLPCESGPGARFRCRSQGPNRDAAQRKVAPLLVAPRRSRSPS